MTVQDQSLTGPCGLRPAGRAGPVSMHREAGAVAVRDAKASGGSYAQILRSTTIIGGSSVVNIALRVVRTKLTALLVGPVGVGLAGTFTSLADSVATLVVLGLDSGGVKQIAESAIGDDREKIARTAYSLRVIVRGLGVVGAVVLVALSLPLSNLTFGSARYSGDVVLLSGVVLMMALTNGEVAVIQGMQRIADLARLNIWTALTGTLLTVPLLYFWGLRGIVASLVGAWALTYASAWWYARKVELPRVRLRASAVRGEVSPMVSLGLAIMVTALMAKGTAYVLNVVVARRLGLAAVGLYQAATVLSSVYVGFILDAMVKDYLPRLTKAGSDDAAGSRLVNEQAEIGLLLAAPGIIATLTFAPTLIEYFYSREFAGAFAVLRWQVLGVLVQVGSWPIALIFQARGRGSLIVWTSLAASVVHVALLYGGIAAFGLVGTGMALFGMRAFHAVVTYAVARRVTGFRWSTANVRLACALGPLVVVVFVSGSFLSYVPHLVLGSTLAVAVGLYSLRRAVRVAGPGAFGLLRWPFGSR